MKSNEESKFVLRKGMNVVRTRYPRDMTRTDMKFIHLIQVMLKRWALDNDFKPSDDLVGIEAYRGVDTSFTFPVEDLAIAIGSNKSALTKILKDDDNNTIYRNGFPLRRITEYMTSVVGITIEIDSKYVSGAMAPIATAIYDNDLEVCRLETSQTMAAVLLDSAFEKNSSFVDMQLQMSLKSLMASHILDRISRFKGTETNYKCSIRSLIDECGINEGSISKRDGFINSNIRRPLEQIENASNGMWVRIGSGFDVSRKRKGLSLDDTVTFKMRYNEPKKENTANTTADGLVQAKLVKSMVDDYQFGVPHDEQGGITKEMLDAIRANITGLFGPDEEVAALKLGAKVGKIELVMQFNDAGMGEAALMMKNED